MANVIDRLKTALADRYVIRREVGRGGMASVFLAEERHPERQVAIKLLDPEIAAILGPERFLREVDLAAKLTHPHILALHSAGEADGLLYYVMPYIEGDTLRDRLQREKQLPLDDALRIARGDDRDGWHWRGPGSDAERPAPLSPVPMAFPRGRRRRGRGRDRRHRPMDGRSR